MVVALVAAGVSVPSAAGTVFDLVIGFLVVGAVVAGAGATESTVAIGDAVGAVDEGDCTNPEKLFARATELVPAEVVLDLVKEGLGLSFAVAESSLNF